MSRKILGAALIAIPFVAVYGTIAYLVGLLPMLSLLGAVFLIVAMIGAGVMLLSPPH